VDALDQGVDVGVAVGGRIAGVSSCSGAWPVSRR
jgi:hypothetical protein